MKSFFKFIIILFVCFYRVIFICDEIYSYDREVDVYYDDFLILEIPQIDFVREIYYEDSDINDVDFNVILLRESDVKRNLFLFAGHSGYGDNAFFNDLVLLNIGDIIYVDKYSDRLLYEIKDIYLVFKTGNIDVMLEDNLLYLVTCSLVYQGMQLVIVAKLIV